MTIPMMYQNNNMRYLLIIISFLMIGCSKDPHRDDFKGQNYSGSSHYGWNLVQPWDRAVYDKISELEKRLEVLENKLQERE